jgi:hypothetical protein
MAERNVQASHRLGPILVTLAGDRAIAQLVTIIDIPFKLEGIEVMLSSHTRLLLRAERREGVWRLSGFDPVYLRDEIAPVIPGQTVAIDPTGSIEIGRAATKLLEAGSMSPTGNSEKLKVLAGPSKIDGGAYRWVRLPDGDSRVEEWKPGTGWVPGNASLAEIADNPPVSAELAERLGIPASELNTGELY